MFLERRIATVEQGMVQGIPGSNPGNTVFKGIPFAKPPVGELRFRPPEEADAWEGVRMCSEFAPAAIQCPGRNKGEGLYHREFKPALVEESEDCLYLNIWTPSLEPETPLPVMFWIHGGGFINGYCYEMEFDGEAFCKRGVILVTVPYRLAALGFLAHPALSARSPQKSSGNYGLLDVIAALTWVKRNIAAFGGDPENITVFGQSAGGAMVQCLLSSPLTEGLFQHAIVQSAGGISSVGCSLKAEEAEQLGLALCARVQLTEEDLLTLPAEVLNARILAAAQQEKAVMGLSPVIDGWVLGEAPGRAALMGRQHPVDIMTGAVTGDGELFSGGRERLRKSPHIQALSEAYHAGEEELLAAHGFAIPLAWAKMQERLGKKPLYLYFFNRNLPGDDSGAFHSSELWYVFGTLDRCWRTFEAGDYQLSLNMLDAWTHFARTGKPGEGTQIGQWLAFRENQPLYQLFNETLPGMQSVEAWPLANALADLMIKAELEK